MQSTKDQALRAKHFSHSGFTLIELIVGIGIFTGVIIAFLTAFVFVSKNSVTDSTEAEVATQSQFLLQTIQYYIERSSLVDIATSSATSTLQLRMASTAEDPVKIQLTGSAVILTVAG